LKTLLQHALTIAIAFLVLLQPSIAPQEFAAKQLDPRLKARGTSSIDFLEKGLWF